MPLVGIAGRKRSGKDTLARFLVEFVRERTGAPTVITRFAYPLKGLVLGALGLTSYFGDDEPAKQSRDRVTSVQAMWVVRYVTSELSRYGLPALTPDEVHALLRVTGQKLGEAYRFLLQYVGTDVFRRRDPDFWVKRFGETLDSLRQSRDGWIVVPDVRFPNEALAVQERGGVLVRVRREALVDEDPHPSEALVDTLAVDREYTVPEGLENVRRVAEDVFSLVLNQGGGREK